MQEINKMKKIADDFFTLYCRNTKKEVRMYYHIGVLNELDTITLDVLATLDRVIERNKKGSQEAIDLAKRILREKGVEEDTDEVWYFLLPILKRRIKCNLNKQD